MKLDNCLELMRAHTQMRAQWAGGVQNRWDYILIEVYNAIRELDKRIERLEELENESDKIYKWKEWEGGDCPVAAGGRVDFRYQTGETYYDADAHELVWNPDHTYIDRIVAYRVCKPEELENEND